MEAKRILVIEDERKIRDAIGAYLEHAGYEAVMAGDGIEGIRLFQEKRPDLVILDLMLPGMSGEEVCQKIRRQSRVPVIMLTAKVLEEDKLRGFELGADDYMVKPFSPREMMARIQSVFRRCDFNKEPLFNVMSWNNGDLEVWLSSAIVKKKGQEVRLTPNEYKILTTLIQYPKKVFTREELIILAFGDDYDGYDRTVDTHIKNLRSKIEDEPGNPDYIKTVRGIGYRFGGECEREKE